MNDFSVFMFFLARLYENIDFDSIHDDLQDDLNNLCFGC